MRVAPALHHLKRHLGLYIQKSLCFIASYWTQQRKFGVVIVPVSHKASVWVRVVLFGTIHFSVVTKKSFQNLHFYLKNTSKTISILKLIVFQGINTYLFRSSKQGNVMEWGNIFTICILWKTKRSSIANLKIWHKMLVLLNITQYRNVYMLWLCIH